jgi:hypothetical protein
MTSHPASKIPATTHHSQIETKSQQHGPPEKHATPNHQSSTKIDQRPSPIVKGDYAEYEVELDAGKDFSGEVTASGLVNIYLLDEDNLDNLDQGEEFWSETGEEGVENAKLEFTPPSKGKWFFVVENADDRAVSATVKIQKGSPVSPASA